MNFVPQVQHADDTYARGFGSLLNRGDPSVDGFGDRIQRSSGAGPSAIDPHLPHTLASTAYRAGVDMGHDPGGHGGGHYYDHEPQSKTKPFSLALPP